MGQVVLFSFSFLVLFYFLKRKERLDVKNVRRVIEIFSLNVYDANYSGLALWILRTFCFFFLFFFSCRLGFAYFLTPVRNMAVNNRVNHNECTVHEGVMGIGGGGAFSSSFLLLCLATFWWYSIRALWGF
jgi:hypothetical protein